MAPSGFYRPLDPQSQQIRLLRILPSTEFDAPLHCSITVASLEADPPPIYQALSYVWGDLGQNAEVNIEGNDGPTTIGLNLSLALRYIRHDSDIVVLWADALCINQEDFQERMHQVRTMGLVYSRAKEVIAWLGEGDGDTPIAIEFLENWAMLIKISNLLEMRAKFPRPAIVEQIQKAVIPAPGSRAYLAVFAFAENRYWSRAWICQELSLGKNVVFQCGRVSKTLDFLLEVWEGITTVVITLSKWYEASPLEPIIGLRASSMSRMLTLVHRLRGMKWETLPLSLLYDLRHTRSTNPRDKVFALLGFVARDGPFLELITPDYEKSTEQVYSDATRYFILTEQTLDVLNFTPLRLSIGCPPPMPTWLPSWRLEGRYRRLDADEFGIVRNLKKSNFVSRLVTFLHDGKLSTKGFKLDVISEVFSHGYLPFELFGDTLDLSPAFQNFVKCIVSGPLVRRETALSAFVRLMDYKQHPEDNGFFERAAFFLRYIYLTNKMFRSSMVDISSSSLVAAFLGVEAVQSEKERLESFVLGRGFNHASEYDLHLVRYNDLLAGCSIFRTDGGSLGMGSEGLAKGDVVCHLAAHPKPFILRPAGPNYTNLKDCAVLDLDLPEVKEEMIPDMSDFVIDANSSSSSSSSISSNMVISLRKFRDTRLDISRYNRFLERIGYESTVGLEVQ